jgi:hypothetical protein
MPTLAEQVEALASPSRDIDDAIWLAVTPGATIKKSSYVHKTTGRECYIRQERINGGPLQIVPHYTNSLDAVRSLGGMCVFASDIGADGLALVKLVADTSATPIVEYTGIASRLEHAWLAAALRMRGM